ncbi:MAG: hypothetical protein AB7G48_02345 [Nitrospiraceae bacterium]
MRPWPLWFVRPPLLIAWLGLLSLDAEWQLGWADDRPSKPTALHSIVEAAESDPFATRSCRRVDLLGTWELVTFTARFRAKDPTAAYLYPHQVFQFSVDGSMKSAHSPKAFVGSPGHILDKVPSVLRYEMDADYPGRITVRSNGSGTAAETWQCLTITSDQTGRNRPVPASPGDLVMTLVGKNGEPLFVRYLRKPSRR